MITQVSVGPHGAFLHVREVRVYMLVTCHTQCVCCDCKNLLANDVSVILYCLPTNVCFWNYVISKMTLDIIKAEMQIIWNCF